MRSPGFSLVEMLTVVAIALLAAAVAIPNLQPVFAESHLLGAARSFEGQFRLAASMAVRGGVYTAIRFERHDDDSDWYAVYRDGNGNGVRTADIESGEDALVSGPFPLTAGAPAVRVGINAGTPEIPPERGTLTGDPIRFGRSEILSFSPLGTATPGTFYLAGAHAQAAVRVTGGSARVRVMVCRGGRWRER